MSAPGLPGGGTLAEPETSPTVGSPFEEQIAVDHQLLIDRLIPSDPSRTRRLLTAAIIVVAGTAVGLAWQIGLIMPEPTLRSESIQSATLGIAPDGEHVTIDGLMFENASMTTLELADIEVDAPGLVVDRITWTEPLSSGSMPPQELPIVMAPGGLVRIELWARPETCTDPGVGLWGEVRGRWRYPDRPSWWGRSEPLDNPLWNADADPHMVSSEVTPSALSLNPVTVVGEELELQGPLSGACLLLGIDQ